MKLSNVDNIPGLFKVIEECKGRIDLVSPEGDWINLKSKLGQYFVLANAFSDGYIKELELRAYNEEDASKIIKFMYQGE